MSYPPPPGLKPSQNRSSSSTPPVQSLLPPRPPPAAGLPSSFRPVSSASPSLPSAPGTRAYNGGSNERVNNRPDGGFSAFTTFQPRSIASGNQAFRTQSPVVSAGPTPPTSYTNSQSPYPNNAYQPQQTHQQQATTSYGQGSRFQESYESTPPQIRNPFPLPSQTGAARGPGREPDVDPEMEAQIAQWQSAYNTKEFDSRQTTRTLSKTNTGLEGGASSTGANTAPLGNRQDAGGAPINMAAASTDTGVASVVTGADGKQKTVVRSGGGQSWQDSSLLEWDPAHFRLFVGNLAGEVTDESLLKAFSKYPGVQKARVVRDKRTTKSKGYGFVSFADGEEYLQAVRDMQGKYIGSHPVLLRKSTTEIRPTMPQDKNKHGKGGKGAGNGGKGNGGGGIQKKQNKTKGGLKVLG